RTCKRNKNLQGLSCGFEDTMIIRKNIKKKEEGYIQLIVKQTYINKKTKKNQEEDKGLNTTL
ncbi:hypothetical protein, partial [Prevotella histicola]